MQFTPELNSGTLLRRYKRFLTDIRLADGQEITIHCPNTGSMRRCLYPGERVWFSTSPNPKRKYPNTWEQAQDPLGNIIGINTHNANKLVVEAITNNVIKELQGYQYLRTEVKYGKENSRIDIMLSNTEHKKSQNLTQQPINSSLADCYVEVKSCTLLEDPFSGIGYFPDAVTARGQKHLRELMQMVDAGFRAVLIFAVQHTGITSVQAAAHIDTNYAILLQQAAQKGVEIFAYSAQISAKSITLVKSCPVNL